MNPTTPQPPAEPTTASEQKIDHAQALRLVAAYLNEKNWREHITVRAASDELDRLKAELEAATEQIAKLKDSELTWAASSDAYAEKLDSATELNRRLREALQRIEGWQDFPPATSRDGVPVSYGWAYGSNGERDFMRGVAREALALTTPPAATDRKWVETDILAWIRKTCRVVCYASSNGYPIEHAPLAGKDGWALLEQAHQKYIETLRESPPAPPTPEGGAS